MPTFRSSCAPLGPSPPARARSARPDGRASVLLDDAAEQSGQLSLLAVREALDIDNGNTALTIIVGFIGYMIVLAVVGLVLAAIGFGVNLLTGGLA